MKLQFSLYAVILLLSLTPPVPETQRAPLPATTGRQGSPPPRTLPGPEWGDPTRRTQDEPGTGVLLDISGKVIPLGIVWQGPPRTVKGPAPKIPPVPAVLPPIPAGVPLHYSQGVANYDLSSMPGGPLDWRYQYLAGGVNTGNGWYGWYPGNGGFVPAYLDASTSAGYRTVFIYYQIEQSGPYFNSVQNLTSPEFMAQWLLDFKRLMQVCAGHGRVLINMEPDMLGYWEQASTGNDPASIPAQVASSGFPEAQGYPNNAKGVMQVFAHLRDLYAPNVILGLDISQWGPGDDVVYSLHLDPGYDWQAHAATLATFLTRSGEVPSGPGYEILFYSPLDRDAAYYELVYGTNVWWDPGNTTQPTFDTMGAWVGQVIQSVGKRALMWQVPIGNALYRSENNTTGHYQDNRPAYFLNSATGRAHMSGWADRGIVGMMWGAGAGGQSNYYDAQGDGITNPLL